jgi:hypothetical protein
MKHVTHSKASVYEDVSVGGIKPPVSPPVASYENTPVGGFGPPPAFVAAGSLRAHAQFAPGTCPSALAATANARGKSQHTRGHHGSHGHHGHHGHSGGGGASDGGTDTGSSYGGFDGVDLVPLQASWFVAHRSLFR